MPLLETCGCRKVDFFPPPLPLTEPAWNFEVPLSKRRGIFVGTSQFSALSRNHIAAILLADELSRELGCPLAVENSEGRRGGMILKSLRKKNPLLFIVEAPVPYADRLRVMALHRIVWQLDRSSDDGWSAGDALLCRMPCLGGNGTIDRIAFPGFSFPLGENDLLSRARSLLTDDELWQKSMADSLDRALAVLSLSAAAGRLAEIHPHVSARPA